ncbi:LrgB family protein [Microbulbifer flavimaris]|uniref:LrgB family protein n=1 Tax=Microbulbifer flavimaris TaxID=1781068 RepID=A0ABX4I218_9GAMM|nr:MULTISPECIES: LrgB family protein [Microbulbifer]KUJ83905.1 LrgB family protein [Microbulbifer sp. ZGT114]PCO06083.1 LrgB family protein [Microbulbifer flavimaris]
MTELLVSPPFILALNFFAFLLGLAIYRRSGTPLLHPIVGASAFTALALWLLHIPYGDYQRASGLLYALLGPAVVALAVPLRQNLPIIRRAAWPLLVTLVVSAALAPVAGVLIALLLGAAKPILLALSGKAVTTPIALGLAEKVGAAASLTVGIVVFSGVVGAVLGPPLLSRLGIRDQRVLGFALGINAHAIGTARALEISALCGAFAALSMGLCGALTAFALPFFLGR